MEPNTMVEKSLAHQLRDAASAGNLHEVRRLVRLGASVNDRSAANNTALLYAAMHGKLECVEFLLESGEDANIANDTGYMPLITAAAHGDYKTVKRLLNSGAEQWHALKDEQGSLLMPPRTVLSLAQRNHHHQVVELLEGVGALQAHSSQ